MATQDNTLSPTALGILSFVTGAMFVITLNLSTLAQDKAIANADDWIMFE